MIRVRLPFHLKTLAHVSGEIEIDGGAAPTLGTVLEALEASYPVLRGTIRDHSTRQLRPFLRLYACSRDLSQEPINTPLPQAVAVGEEPLFIIGAIAGG
jgi:molybdopterin synthase sulfur carrier subunit